MYENKLASHLPTFISFQLLKAAASLRKDKIAFYYFVLSLSVSNAISSKYGMVIGALEKVFAFTVTTISCTFRVWEVNKL